MKVQETIIRETQDGEKADILVRFVDYGTDPSYYLCRYTVKCIDRELGIVLFNRDYSKNSKRSAYGKYEKIIISFKGAI